MARAFISAQKRLIGLAAMGLLTLLAFVGYKLIGYYLPTNLDDELPKLAGPYPTKRAAIVITLDDGYIQNWYANSAWLDSLGLKVTFFVTERDPLTPQDWALLDSLRHQGHAIEAHGAMHYNAIDYLTDHDTTAWLDVEVLPNLKSLTTHGYLPTAFAWPYGASAPLAIPCLGQRFKLIRGCCHPRKVALGQFQDALYRYDGARVINALCLDNGLYDSIVVKQAIKAAAKDKSAVVFYGHELVNSPANRGQTNKANIEQVVRWQRQYHLVSITIPDLTKGSTIPTQ